MDSTPGVIARSWTAAFALAATTAAFVLAKTGRDALYFMGGGLNDLPGAYLCLAALAVPTSFALLALVRRIGARPARLVVTFGTALFLVLASCRACAGGGMSMTMVFVLIALLFGAVFSGAWLLAADLLERAPDDARERAYAVIGAAAIAGGALGALGARAFAMRVPPQALMGAAAVMLVLAGGAMAVAHSRCPWTGATAEPMPHPRAARGLFAERYPRLLLAIGMLAALAGMLVEFRFYLAAATSGNDMRANAHFFATSYFALNGTALLLQLAILPGQALARRGGLFALPLCLLGGGAALLALRAAALPTVLRVAEGSLKTSIHRVSWEQAYLPLAHARRAAAKLAVDGLGAHLAEGAGALLVLAWLRNAGMHADAGWAGWLLLAVTAAWLLLTVRLRSAPSPSS